MSHVYLNRMYILLLGIVGYAYLLNLVDLLCCYFLTYLLSACSIHYCEWVIEVSNSYGETAYFFLKLCQFWLHIF